MLRALPAFAALILVACGESKPEHYYVLCEDVDGDGWRLVNYHKDANGYLLSCTYQAPDRSQVRTLRCTENGCD